MANPRLFIASSRESLPLAEVFAEKLKAAADVKIWTKVFQSQQTYLERLRELPELFDFGAFLLGPDDTVMSRNAEHYVPRDNVIFELGLFMEVLGVKRTFPVVPQGVKICSDFSGWKFIEYKEPEGWKEFRESIENEKRDRIRQSLIDGYKTDLAKVVEGAAAEMAAIIREEGPNHDLPVRPVAGSVIDIWPSVKELVGNAARAGSDGRRTTVLHMALDMAEAWNLLRDGILGDDRITDLTWRCLMIDPDSPDIVAIESESVSTDSARRAISNIQQTLAEPHRRQSLEQRKIVVEFRTCPEPPRLHGFMIEGQGLLLSMCGLTAEGKLNASRTPYFRYSAREQSHPCHVVNSFHDWFEFHWAKKPSSHITATTA